MFNFPFRLEQRKVAGSKSRGPPCKPSRHGASDNRDWVALRGRTPSRVSHGFHFAHQTNVHGICLFVPRLLFGRSSDLLYRGGMGATYLSGVRTHLTGRSQTSHWHRLSFRSSSHPPSIFWRKTNLAERRSQDVHPPRDDRRFPDIGHPFQVPPHALEPDTPRKRCSHPEPILSLLCTQSIPLPSSRGASRSR